jgi:hypothetical protein
MHWEPGGTTSSLVKYILQPAVSVKINIRQKARYFGRGQGEEGEVPVHGAAGLNFGR